MALTNTGLKALKPRDKPYTVADERGLYVEVFPTGGIVYRSSSPTALRLSSIERRGPCVVLAPHE